RLAAVHRDIAGALRRSPAEEISFASLRFEIGAHALGQMTTILSSRPRLWADFQQAIQAHRETTHRTILLEHAVFVGKLQTTLHWLERQIGLSPRDTRQGLVYFANRVDGEIGWARDMADRRDLAERINEQAGIPLIDGLSMRALTYALGEDPDLWRDLQA